MSAAGTTHTTSRTWRALLPADREYVVLPSRARPVLVADREPAVLEYVRRSLLARPPGSRLPGWVYESARRALRMTAVWRLAPTWRPASESPAAEGEFPAWVREAGYRVVVLEHSHDPDHRAVLLLFAPGSALPRLAVKVAGTPQAEARIAAERARLAALQHLDLGALRGSIPQLVDLPVDAGATLLATTAVVGEPMFVDYYRNGHNRRPDRVRHDFDLAGRWLATLQAERTGPAAPLDLPPGTAETVPGQLADRPAADCAAVQSGLAALRSRLRAHCATSRVVHGDFWAGNLMVAEGAVCGVVDWERWEPVGSPVRDLGRFAVAYSLYLDRQTRPGAPVRGHAGLVAGSRAGGVGYALRGAGWYPEIVRGFLTDGLTRLGLPAALGTDVVLAELAAVAAESTDGDFAQRLWSIFAALAQGAR